VVQAFFFCASNPPGPRRPISVAGAINQFEQPQARVHDDVIDAVLSSATTLVSRQMGPRPRAGFSGQALAAFPRVRSSEAFGRRPTTGSAARARAGIRNPSRKKSGHRRTGDRTGRFDPQATDLAACCGPIMSAGASSLARANRSTWPRDCSARRDKSIIVEVISSAAVAFDWAMRVKPLTV
jgi:hypothetical protein